jgi:hypothetical protein
MDNPEKSATQGTQDEEKQNTIHYVLDTTTRKHTQTTDARHQPSHKQPEAKTNRESLACGNRNGHHNTEQDERHGHNQKTGLNSCARER